MFGKKKIREKEAEIASLQTALNKAKEKNNLLEKNLRIMWKETPPLVKMFKEFREFYFKKFPGAPMVMPTNIFLDFIREYKEKKK